MDSGPGPAGPSRNDELLRLSPFQLLASRQHGTLYLGVTNDLVRRVQNQDCAEFHELYGVDRLVWFEIYDDPATAISREKELKKCRRDWKVRLIEEQSPDWRDLYGTIVK